MNESLIIDLELLCGCDCENPDHPVNKLKTAARLSFTIFFCFVLIEL